MAITLATQARNAACDAIVDAVDVGAGTEGTLEIQAGATVLATFTLANPAFGDAAAGVATLNSVSDVTASATGTADSFEVKDADGDVVYDGTVAESGGDLTITNTDINSGDTVSITSHTFTVPAS